MSLRACANAADRRHSSRGAALLVALAAIVVVGVLASALGAVVLADIRSARRSSSDDMLLNVAESGVEVAISRLASDPAWPGRSEAGASGVAARRRDQAVPVPGGVCTVSVRPDGEGGFEVTSRVESSAVPSGQRRRLGATPPKPPLALRGPGRAVRTCTVRVRIERDGHPAFSIAEWEVRYVNRPERRGRHLDDNGI